MKAIGPYLHCFKCGNSYEWQYQDNCPNCKQDTEANLHDYHTHMSNVEKQAVEHGWTEENEFGMSDYDAEREYEEYLEELAQEDNCANTIFDGTCDEDRMGL